MCGFVAIHQWELPVEEDELRQMTEILAHRGPDDMQYHIDHRLGLGFRRLAILDHAGGQQPMANPTQDVWIVFNGEIYNHEELRSWLAAHGYPCATRSDTEVILRLYEVVGEKTPRYLRGMFSFVLWDKRRQQLLAARDPFGIKPLCYTITPHGILFASETKSLLQSPSVTRTLDPHAIYHYFTFQYIPEPATMFSNIQKIPAGHLCMMSTAGGPQTLHIEPYAILRLMPDEDASMEDHTKAIRAALFDSIDAHRRCDVPYGCFLSSGIDSAIIAALLRQYGPLRTFSVGFTASGHPNELPSARRIAQALQTEHHELSITPEFFSENLARLVWHYDEPIADPSAIPLFFLARMASRYGKVVLSGEGADELFGGYGIYREPHMVRPITSLPLRVQKLLSAWAARLPEGMYGRSYLLRGTLPLEERFIGNARLFSEEAKAELFRPAFPSPHDYHGPGDITGPLYSSTDGLDSVARMQHIDIHTWLRGDILVKADRMTMAHSLEARVPFLDGAVFAAAARIPTRYKICRTTTKWILREAVRPYLPSEVIRRPKLGFPVPLRHWLRRDLYQWAHALLSEHAHHPIINTSYALNLLHEHARGHKDHSRNLWSVLIFLLWYNIYAGTGSAPTVEPSLLRTSEEIPHAVQYGSH